MGFTLPGERVPARTALNSPMDNRADCVVGRSVVTAPPRQGFSSEQLSRAALIDCSSLRSWATRSTPARITSPQRLVQPRPLGRLLAKSAYYALPGDPLAEPQMKGQPMRLLFSTVLLPAAALAATGFDGTWKTNLESMKTTGKSLVLLLAGGEYTCSSCTPPYTVKADGAEHRVTGQAYFDTAKVKVIGPNSAEIVLKKGSKEMVRFSDTVSADGTTLISKVTNNYGAHAETDELTAKRTAAAPAKSHPLSGAWLEELHVGGNLSTVQYRMTAEGFQMRGNGQSYEAKFDGKEYPIVGDPGKTTVSLKKIDDATVEETDYRQGKVVNEIRLALAKDGDTINVIDKNIALGQTTTYTMGKQR
jgi:hypothetical protein